MARDLAVQGGQGGVLPGAIGPEELDGRLEWTPVRGDGDLLGAVAARLGSPADPVRVVLATLAPLRGWLEGPALDALLGALPWPVARELPRAEEYLLAPIPRATGAGDYLATVARLAGESVAGARAHATAVLAALEAVLQPDELREIAGRLPPDLADLWMAAR